MSATECYPDVWVPLTFLFGVWARVFFCVGILGRWHFDIFYSQITSDGSTFYVPSASSNLGKWFYSPNHANIHTVLEYNFQTELYYINSSIITNFYLYIFFSENSIQWKIRKRYQNKMIQQPRCWQIKKISGDVDSVWNLCSSF